MDRALSFFPPFRGVSNETKTLMDELGTVRRFRAGAVLYRDGAASNEVFAILKGRIKVGRVQENGLAVALDMLGTRDILGLVGALLGRPHTVTASALSPVAALAWPASLLMERMAADAALSLNLSVMLTHRLRQLANLVEELAPLSVEPRLARMLLRLADRMEQAGDRPGEIPITQTDLAEYARTTVPTISRVMKRWRQASIVAGHRGRVVLIDRERLVGIARDLD